jgi:hypothetical protein
VVERVSERERERKREGELCGSLYCLFLFENICFIKQACLLAAHVHKLYIWYMPIFHCRINSLHHFSLYENICLSYKTSLLACNCFQFWGGG